jgi:hypothetical protein
VLWFGETWGAPCCDPKEHTPTPVGAPCRRCRKTIGARECGLVMPSVCSFDHPPDVGWCAYHLDCFLACVLGTADGA